MDSLSSLSLQPAYHKGEDDIAEDFYLPCMKRSVRYDRAIGYFRSSIYLIAWDSLRRFVKNGGKMRIICSPEMADSDSEAIKRGYEARTDEQVAKSLQNTIQEMLASNTLCKPTMVLASLVAKGIVEFKIATFDKTSSPRHSRLFHDKVGIFCDHQKEENGNVVVFKGSMNETWAGLSMDGNLESIDVYVSWGDKRELERVKSEQEYFDSLWNNDYKLISVKDFPSLAQNELISAAESVKWEPLLEDIMLDVKKSRNYSPDSGPNPRTPLPHQKEALEQLEERGRRGIFKHATGSGKTFTALCAIRESLKQNEVPIILVPSTDLLTQWKQELDVTNQDLAPKLLVCGGGRTSWRDDALLRTWTRSKRDARIVLSTMQTAVSDDFVSLLKTGDHIFLIADEVHRMGSVEHQKLLELDTGPRLGLSATPTRAGDPEGTEAIMKYFEGIVQPPFSLNDAINAGRLTPYFYHVHTTTLTEEEQTNWEAESIKIAQKYARIKSMDNADPWSSKSLKQLLISRANIVKQAQNKVQLAQDVINSHYQEGDKWLIYCSDLDQLTDVYDSLHRRGYDVVQYHSKMQGNRKQTLNYFERQGGLIVSIKCLDEGIDIPNATHALILASSQNPREFIQRRGRVLRKSKNKNFAHIHDAIVLPHFLEESAPSTNIIIAELSRAIQFGEDAMSAKSVADIKEIAINAGVDLNQVAKTGFEIDETHE